MSTRRGSPVADVIAGNLAGRYILHDVLSNGTAPLHELSEVDLVIFEAPSVARPQFEHHVGGSAEGEGITSRRHGRCSQVCTVSLPRLCGLASGIS